MPELSLGRRNHQAGSAKVGLFAYDRVTREPVWQAGVKRGASDVRDTWLMGLGPYQTRTQKGSPLIPRKRTDGSEPTGDPLAAYNSSLVFERAVRPADPAAAADNPANPAPAAGASFSRPTP